MIGRIIDRSRRLGLFDPLLSAARVGGVARWGATLSALVYANAMRRPHRAAIIDDHGTLTYCELERLAEGLAVRLRADTDLNAEPSPVGVICRNHRGFPLAQLALERAGRDAVLLNTGLTDEQIARIVEREGLDLVLADSEFADRIEAAGIDVRMLPLDPAAVAGWATRGFCPPPRRTGGLVILTSGTTGPPKGARRSPQRASLGDVGMLDALPMQMNDVMLVASPLFHAWGLAQSGVALATGSTLVLHTRFDPERTLDTLEEHEVTVLAVVPIMLTRLLRNAPEGLELPFLRATISSGNVLSAPLATAWIDRFGPNLYNVYGSTETALASVAKPSDLVNAPGTVGRPPAGVTVAILDENGDPVPDGTVGRVFTGNSMQFDGYTDGSTKTRHGALMATGDMGWFDTVGRLFVDGRENDMIVTGGENVFPAAIEEVLEQHPEVRQAAVVGQSDDEFGQRIVAYVVPMPDAGALTSSTLADWSLDRFAPYERPRDIHIVESLPMTTTGKVIRHALTPPTASTKKARK